ncbi:MAG: hypothetical protein ACNA76_03260 [Anaerosomatales bacterium]|nr:hypothetical protein [Coriobacteriia bacterium]
MTDAARDAHKAKAEAKLDEWSARLKQLEAKARASSADAAIEFDKAADDLRDKIEELRAKASEGQDDLESDLERLGRSAEGAWEAIKDRL